MLQPCLETLELSDGYRAAVRWWRPPNPRGAVLYFHGIQSHGGWYEASGSHLAEAGLTVLMPDRRGSGLNQQQRGHAPSATRCVDDAADALDALLTASGSAAAHVVGVSWGGKLAVALASAHGPRVRSISLIAPGLFPRVDVSAPEKFRIAMSLVNDRQRPFDIPLNDPRMFTANPARIAFVEGDALRLTQVTAAFLLAGRRLDRLAPRFGRTSWNGSVHLMLAGRDRIIDNERTSRWLRDLPWEDRQITLYRDAHHTIEFEADPSAFFDDLTRWIVERCDGADASPRVVAAAATDR
jgi:alpha-beta hydrolase superfamily lysophospholipase